MKITKKQFDELMIELDEASDKIEEYAGIENSVMDGEDYSDYDTTEEEVVNILEAALNVQKKIATLLKVPVDFAIHILDSSTVNRWEMYQYIRGGK